MAGPGAETGVRSCVAASEWRRRYLRGITWMVFVTRGWRLFAVGHYSSLWVQLHVVVCEIVTLFNTGHVNYNRQASIFPLSFIIFAGK